VGDAEVPLEVNVPGEPRRISIERRPGRAPKYTVEAGLPGFDALLRVSPHPERPGKSSLYVTAFDVIGDELALKSAVLTFGAGDGPVRRVPLLRLGPGRFVADVVLAEGRNQVAVVARSLDDVRLRAAVELDVRAS
jgi:hypothetical protein